MFSVPPSRAHEAKYCSLACRRAKVEKVCEGCGASFEVHRYRAGAARFCSTKCRRARVTKTCERCSGEYEVHLCDAERSRFCSRDCANGPRVSLTCDRCGTDFTRSPGRLTREGRGKYCSRECANGPSVKKTCDNCGAPYTCKPSENATSRFCSHECYSEDKRLYPTDSGRSNHARRKAASLGAPGLYTKADIVRIWHKQRGECARCGVRFGKKPGDGGFHADHVTPLSRGGCNWPRNIQLLCPTCNRRKWARTPAEFTLYLRRIEEADALP